MPDLERLHVQLIPKSADALQRAIALERMSKTDIVNRAIQLYAFVAEQTTAGAEILIHHSDGSSERVHIL